MDLGGPKETCVRWGTYWRNLANTIELSMCGGDAAFLSNYVDHLLIIGTTTYVFILTFADGRLVRFSMF